MANKIFIYGNLTADPELRVTDTQKSVCSFTIADNSGYGENKKTNFINCVAWSGLAEFIAKWFTKGKPILVWGELQTRTYEKDGQKRYITEVRVTEANFCGSKSETADDTTTNNSDFIEINEPSDLPF